MRFSHLIHTLTLITRTASSLENLFLGLKAAHRVNRHLDLPDT